MYNSGNTSKNVTGASVVDGTMESADFADNGLSGDKIDGGIISNFQSTGIDDRLPTDKVLTLNTTGVEVNRLTSDGNVVDVKKDGVTVGSLGARGGDAYFETGNTGIRLYDAGSAIFPSGGTGISQDNLISLGASNFRFKNLYLGGNADIDGNLVIGTSGKGIDFSATADGSGTSTSELLDDYEEGTFTPVWIGSTTSPTNVVSTLQGYYTKIGRKVFFDIFISQTSNTVGTGILTMGGLPFPCASAEVGSVAIGYHTLLTYTTGISSATVLHGATTLSLYKYASADPRTGSYIVLDCADLRTGGGALRLSGSYHV